MKVAVWCARQAVLEFMETVADASAEEIAAGADVKPKALVTVLAQLENVGRIERCADNEARWRIRRQ